MVESGDIRVFGEGYGEGDEEGSEKVVMRLYFFIFPKKYGGFELCSKYGTKLLRKYKKSP